MLFSHFAFLLDWDGCCSLCPSLPPFDSCFWACLNLVLSFGLVRLWRSLDKIFLRLALILAACFCQLQRAGTLWLDVRPSRFLHLCFKSLQFRKASFCSFFHLINNDYSCLHSFFHLLIHCFLDMLICFVLFAQALWALRQAASLHLASCFSWWLKSSMVNALKIGKHFVQG